MTTRILCAIALLASGLLLLGLAGPAAAQQPGQGAPMAVTVVTLQPQTITLTTTLPGRVAASAEAEVRPQVNGIILDRLFKEGAHVDAGDPLYEIDPATYKAAVAQARAAVQQAQVQYDNAVTEAQRLNELQSRKVASQQALDNAQATRDAAAAAMQVAEAQLSQAQIDLDRTTIRARLSGEIGLSQTSPSGGVTASQADPLAVIRKLDPVYVDVTQSAADLLRWRRGQSAEVAADADKQVELILAEEIHHGGRYVGMRLTFHLSVVVGLGSEGDSARRHALGGEVGVEHLLGLGLRGRVVFARCTHCAATGQHARVAGGLELRARHVGTAHVDATADHGDQRDDREGGEHGDIAAPVFEG